MRRQDTDEARWAENEMLAANLGDERRCRRVTRMLSRAAQRPAGKLTDVIRDAAELQGAYDLLEGGRVDAQCLCASFASATLDRASGEPWIFAAIDGTSVRLTDLTHKKGFGTIGSLQHGARGMKVINVLAVDPRGATIGLLGQVWWARTSARPDARDKRKRNAARPVREKETQYWIDAIEQASRTADNRGVRLWFQLDREADNRDILIALASSGHDFTVRGAWDRVIEASGQSQSIQHVRQHIQRESAAGRYEVEVSGAPNRSARIANMIVRTARVTLEMRRGTRDGGSLVVNVVLAHEESTVPAGEKPLDWLLLTSRPIETFEDAYAVINGYAQRWRVEEFHRSWKSSVCRVEEMQLRSAEAVTVWATMLANVAVRSERLRLLARQQPDRPASIELTEHEVRALILLKKRHRRRNEIVPDRMPTIAQATLWIAQLGGYTGKSSGGPPGAITIRRGLERLVPAAEMLAILGEIAQ